MNTKTAPESCPFCGAGKKRHLPHIAFRWFECGTMTAPAKTPRRDQTPACADAERERLTQERDEARAERDDLLARIKRLEEFVEQLTNPKFTRDDLPKEALLQRIKRLEEAGDELVGTAEAMDTWRKAKEEKP